ncbi:MAG: FAD-binding protein [Firmicutes bacterium]|nr:FAD-binding protein [Bacillota bacterium]
MRSGFVSMLGQVVGRQNLFENVKLCELTTMRVGGLGRVLVKPLTDAHLIDVLKFCSIEGIPYFFLGRGSNVIALDCGFSGVLISLQHLDYITYESGGLDFTAGARPNGRGGGWVSEHVPVTQDTLAGQQCGESESFLVSVGAGVSTSVLGRQLVNRGLTGLEFFVGLPASVGGAVAQNAGAFGQTVCASVVSVVVIHNQKRRIIKVESNARDNAIFSQTNAHSNNALFSPTESGANALGCKQNTNIFGYRTSIFLREHLPIVEVRFGLTFANSVEGQQAHLKFMLDKRRLTQPLEYANSGSIFKNLKCDSGGDIYAAKLIDDAGLKGYTIGGASVSERHANFIVNKGGASASDVVKLIEHIKAEVYKKTGIELKKEVIVLSDKKG